MEYRDRKPIMEPVHVEPLSDGKYQLLYSPGLVQGIAAGDEFRLVGDDGAFEVTLRSGNLALQVFSLEPANNYRAELTQRAEEVLGRLDGQIENGLAFTIPVKVGFAKIERVFKAWEAANSGREWYYGNVYNPRDGVTPLNWWLEEPFSGKR